jgi:hypothetical protein
MEKIKVFLERKKYSIFFVFLFLILNIFFFRKVIFAGGYVVNGEFFTSTNYAFFLNKFLHAWNNYAGLGNSNIGFSEFFGNSSFFITPIGLVLIWVSIYSMVQVFLGGFFNIIFLFSTTFIPFFGMWAFARYWFRNYSDNKFLFNSLVFAASFLFTVNDLLVGRIYAGHITYTYGFGLFPLFILFLIRSIEQEHKRIYYILLTGLVGFFLLGFMPQIFVLSFIFGFFYLLVFNPHLKSFISYVVSYIVSVIIALLLNFGAWFPALFYAEKYPAFNNSVYLTSFLYNLAPFTTLDKILTLASPPLFTPENYNKLLVYINLKWSIPIIFLISLFFVKKRARIFIICLAVVGVILGMGVNFPFEGFYNFLYKNVPLFDYFRDTSKFELLYLFSVSLSIPFLLIPISKISKFLLITILSLLVIFLVLINPIFWSGNILNNLSSVKIPLQYAQLKNFLESDPDNFRFAVYPNNNTVSDYSWLPKVTIGPPFSSIFMIFLPINKDLAISGKVPTDFSSRYLSYIESNLDSKKIIERLAEDRFKYLIVDKNLPNYKLYLSEFSNNDDLKLVKSIDGIEVFKIKAFNSKSYWEGIPVYFFGNINILRSIDSNIILLNLDRNPLQILSKNYSKFILAYGSNIEDIFYNSLVGYRVDFMKLARYDSNPWTSFLPLGNTSLNLISEGINVNNPEAIYTNGKSKIDKKINLAEGRYQLLISAPTTDSLSDKYKVSIGKESFLVTLDNKKQSIQWDNLGTVSVDKETHIIIQNDGSKQLIIDNVLLIPVANYKSEYTAFKRLIADKEIINNYKDANGNKMTLFSETYSPYWKICESDTMVANFYGIAADCVGKKIAPKFTPESLYTISYVVEIILISAFFLLVKKSK